MKRREFIALIGGAGAGWEGNLVARSGVIENSGGTKGGRA
jgi:hypothetical protein